MNEPTKASVRCLYVDASPSDVVVEKVEAAVDGTVATARGYEGALDRLRQTDADCVVSRYDLSDGDGLELAQTLRQDGDERPFVLYTAEDDAELARRAISANVTEYVLDDSDDAVDRLASLVGDAVSDEATRRRRVFNDQLVEQVFDAAPTSMLVIDREGYVRRANATARTKYGFGDETESVFDVVELFTEDGEPLGGEMRPARDVFETGDPLFDWTGRVSLRGGDRHWMRSSVVPIRDDRGVIERSLVSFEDITKERERRKRLKTRRAELEDELTEVFARVTDAFFALDDDWTFTLVNDEAERLVQMDADDLLGESVWDAFPEALDTTFEREYRRAMETQEAVHFEEYFEPLDTWFEVRAFPSDSGLSVYFRDVSERIEQKHELNTRVQQQSVLADLGQRGLEGGDLDSLVAETTERVVETLGAAACEVYELAADGETLQAQFSVGLGDSEHVTEIQAETLASAATEIIDPLSVLQDDAVPASNHDLAGCPDDDAIAVTIGSAGTFWGVLLVHVADVATISTTDRRFLENISAVFATAIARISHETELRRQHERLAAINQLSDVVTDINHALADQSTREEVEQLVVDRIEASESYSFAWIGAPTDDEQIRVREAATEQDLDGVTLPSGEDPPGRAFETGEMQFESDSDLSDDAPIRGRIDDLTYRSAAAIPIHYEGEFYGVLTLYADRDDAFLGRERHVVGQLGEIVGLALGAIEREEKLRERRRQLEHERERLEYVNRLLRHNLLNGLNVAHARADILTGSVTPDMERHLDTVQTRLDDMIGLVETMRSLMRILVEEESHELEPVTLDATLQNEITKVRTAYDDARVTLSNPLPPVKVAADDLLPEVFENLLVNAVEHNDKETPEIAVGVETSGGPTVDVVVADNGPGIPEDIKDHLFEKGKKGSRSSGTGFGLYLVKETLNAYDGEIEVRDRTDGGTEFVVSLPRAETLQQSEGTSKGDSSVA
ncbi:PAS domain-containing protein [Haloarchaeobius sp. DFWS5]|uniref:PAS domain-containing protein n=1 Tax=Haloarchaeobius sp. DFWS5 TaxID=3446114 RepID=UPI003EBB7860